MMIPGGTAALLASFLIVAHLLQEDRPGDNGIRFRLRQTGLVAGPQTTPDGKLTLKVDGLKAQIIEGLTGLPRGPVLEHRPLRADSRITAFAFSRDGKLVAVGTGDPRGKVRGDSAGEVRVWEVATGKLLASINPARGDIGYVERVAFAPDGMTVLVDCQELSGK